MGSNLMPEQETAHAGAAFGIVMYDERGVPLMCETDGCGRVADSVWYGAWHGRPVRACQVHNPMGNVAVPLPVNFTSRTICHACGQPVNFGADPQQVVYPGTAG
jgi:hypothetical protein